jgi:hypothetical protein
MNQATHREHSPAFMQGVSTVSQSVPHPPRGQLPRMFAFYKA